MVTISRFLIGITQVIAGIVSMSFSGWQYQNDSGGITIMYFSASDGTSSLKSLSDVCTLFPYDYLRPFSLSLNNDTGYCGYGDGNTGYRISVAGITFLFGVLFFFPLIENHKFAAHWTLFALTVMWFCATVVDVYAIINGQQGCKDGFTSTGGYSIDCDNSIYGISCAIDFGVSAAMLFLWIFDGYLHPSDTSTSGSSTSNPVSNSSFIKV